MPDLKNTNYHFLSELEMIGNKQIRAVARYFLVNAPEHFFTVPSSSTGKYHPEDERSDQGMMLHTKRVVRVIDHLCRAFAIIGTKRDLIILAALLHDVAARGYDKKLEHINPMHDVEMAQIFQKTAQKIGMNSAQVKFVSLLIEGHMGLWATNPDITNNNFYAQLLYIADYIASRENIFVEVE